MGHSVMGIAFTRFQYWQQFEGHLTKERSEEYARFKEDLEARSPSRCHLYAPCVSSFCCCRSHSSI